MNIQGIGIDIVKIKRIEKVWNKFKKKFSDRILSKLEKKNFLKSKNKVQFLSKSFASKEAFVKALGTGFRNDMSFKKITILNNKLGKPLIQIKNYNINNIYITISHEIDILVAFVIIVK